MEGVVLDVVVGQSRPSRLIAEALVLRHDSAEVKERAEAMGLPEELTRAVIGACCPDASFDEDYVLKSAD